MVIAAAGELDHERLAAGIESRFAGRAGGLAPLRQPPSLAAVPIVVESRETEQAQLVLGVRAPDRHSPERFALAVLNHVLGGGLSSRLFQEIREARGLAYSIGSDRSAYDDAGTLAVSVGTAPDKAHEVLELLHARARPPRRQGDHRARARSGKGPPAAPTCSCRSRTRARGCRASAPRSCCSASVLTTEELLERIAAVTADQVQTVAEQVLLGPRTLAVVGPFAEADFA